MLLINTLIFEEGKNRGKKNIFLIPWQPMKLFVIFLVLISNIIFGFKTAFVTLCHAYLHSEKDLPLDGKCD